MPKFKYSHMMILFVKYGVEIAQLGRYYANQPSATHPPFLTNLPFHDFPKYFNHYWWFTVLGKS